MSRVKPDNTSKPQPRSPDTCQAMYWHPAFYRWEQCGRRKTNGEYCVVHRKELTEEERKILSALRDGLTVKQIAQRMGLKQQRVYRARNHARRALDAETTEQMLYLFAREELQVEAKTIEA